MFTGIIKNQALLKDKSKEGTNLILELSTDILPSLSIDQSVAHNGVCLTIDGIQEDSYRVVAIEESLQKTTIDDWTVGQKINIELAMSANALLDGHILQGHVDGTTTVLNKEDKDGSTLFTISIPEGNENLVIEKGSVALDGISLTSFSVSKDSFQVAIIPYTIEHTSIQNWEVGSQINIEYDIINKLVNKRVEQYLSQSTLGK